MGEGRERLLGYLKHEHEHEEEGEEEEVEFIDVFTKYIYSVFSLCPFVSAPLIDVSVFVCFSCLFRIFSLFSFFYSTNHDRSIFTHTHTAKLFKIKMHTCLFVCV